MLQAFGLLLLFAVFRILTEEDEDDEILIGDAADEEGGSASPGGSAGMRSNGLMLRLIRLIFRVSEDAKGKGKFTLNIMSMFGYADSTASVSWHC